ncbi:MAG: hypothetical protein U0531_21495, partial [Dehalococcoidia bacterium]
NGTVRCWGNNGDGRVGDGTTNHSSTPVSVTGITNATAITVGGNYTCAVIKGRTVRCWGNNSDGQLGDGTTTSSSTPVAVTGITTAMAITAGESHTCALLSGGAVQCWGDNRFRQLDPSGADHTTPVSIPGVTTATAISAGRIHTCAVLSGGGVHCWGNTSNGRLGGPTTATTSASGIDVSLAGAATAVSAGGGHTCAVLSSGAVQCWGGNTSGQLGNGAATRNSLPPVAVTGITTATAVTAGDEHACVLLNTGAVRCWGANAVGQLGNGAASDGNLPRPVTATPRVQAAIGVPSVAATVTARAGVAFDYEVGWEMTEPLVQSDLEGARIALTDASGEPEGMLVFLAEGDGVTIADFEATNLISLDKAASRVEDSSPNGRTFRVVLRLTFAPEAAGKTFNLDIAIGTKHGDIQQLGALGAITVE